MSREDYLAWTNQNQNPRSLRSRKRYAESVSWNCARSFWDQPYLIIWVSLGQRLSR
jgi:hypothetical protein